MSWNIKNIREKNLDLPLPPLQWLATTSTDVELGAMSSATTTWPPSSTPHGARPHPHGHHRRHCAELGHIDMATAVLSSSWALTQSSWSPCGDDANREEKKCGERRKGRERERVRDEGTDKKLVRRKARYLISLSVVRIGSFPKVHAWK